MNDLEEKRRLLLELSRDLGAETRDLAILGEGNTSARLSDETFLVKASGSSLGTLGEKKVVECRFAPLLALIENPGTGGDEIEGIVLGARIDPQARKPSISSHRSEFNPLRAASQSSSPRSGCFRTKSSAAGRVPCSCPIPTRA